MRGAAAPGATIRDRQRRWLDVRRWDLLGPVLVLVALEPVLQLGQLAAELLAGGLHQLREDPLEVEVS